MRVICSYCGILYDLKEPFEDDSISHGCCEICWPWVEHNLNIELSHGVAETGTPQDRESSCHLSGTPESKPRNRSRKVGGPSPAGREMPKEFSRS